MSARPSASADRTPLDLAVRACRRHFIVTGVFSAFSNVLFIAPTLYLLQVYDRVLATGGLFTLLLLSVITAAALGVQALLDWMRSRVLIRAGARLEKRLSGPTIEMVLNETRGTSSERLQAVRDFDTIRQALSGSPMLAVLDAPWAPVYLVLTFFLHPLLGLLTLFGGIAILVLARLNERQTSTPLRTAHRALTQSYSTLEAAVSTSDSIRALGMLRAMTLKHLGERAETIRLQAAASFTGSSYTSAIKGLRFALQSASVGVGAYLAVKGHISAGAIIASSFLLARALAPVEQISAAWPALDKARTAFGSLRAAFSAAPPQRQRTTLPPPTGDIRLEDVSVATPDGARLALKGMNLVLGAGHIIGVTGHSGAGKSTFGRALVGAAPLLSGSIRFDGASIKDWEPDELARHIGYLPQAFTLYEGTIKENITRFRGYLHEDPSELDGQAIQAATAAGAHEMIVQLPQGYDTRIRAGGEGLSAGQAQRVALARALFGRPRILVLDEPNAHLDAESEQRLLKTLIQLRNDGATVVVLAHSQSVLSIVDRIVLIRDGTVDLAGSLREVAHVMKERRASGRKVSSKPASSPLQKATAPEENPRFGRA